MGGRPRNEHNFGNWLSNRIVQTVIEIALRLPYERRVRLVGLFTRYIVAPIAGYRGRALDNLARIYPDMPVAERVRIANTVCDNAGRTLIENYSTQDLRTRMAPVPVHGPGLAALEQAKKDGTPVILISGHYGNYEAARAALVTKGFRIGGLYRPMKNPYFNAHYVQTMDALCPPTFPQGKAGTRGFVKHLRGGGMLVILNDLNQWSGIREDFLGVPANTSVSAAEMALKYKALLIPFYGTRLKNRLDFRVDLEAPIPHSDPETMTQAFNESLEHRIRDNPDQWFWIHRRWKGA